jgi:hypothetical protein
MKITDSTSLQEILSEYQRSVEISEDENFNQLFNIKSGKFKFIMSTGLIFRRIIEQRKLLITNCCGELDAAYMYSYSSITSYLSIPFTTTCKLKIKKKKKSGLFNSADPEEIADVKTNAALPIAVINLITDDKNKVELSTFNKQYLNILTPIIQDLTYAYGINVNLKLNSDDNVFAIVNERSDSYYRIKRGATLLDYSDKHVAYSKAVYEYIDSNILPTL